MANILIPYEDLVELLAADGSAPPADMVETVRNAAKIIREYRTTVEELRKENRNLRARNSKLHFGGQ